MYQGQHGVLTHHCTAFLKQCFQITHLWQWICCVKYVQNMGNAMLNVLILQQMRCFHVIGSTIMTCQKQCTKELFYDWDSYYSIWTWFVLSVRLSHMKQTPWMSARNCFILAAPAAYVSFTAGFHNVPSSGSLYADIYFKKVSESFFTSCTIWHRVCHKPKQQNSVKFMLELDLSYLLK